MNCRDRSSTTIHGTIVAFLNTCYDQNFSVINIKTYDSIVIQFTKTKMCFLLFGEGVIYCKPALLAAHTFVKNTMVTLVYAQ